MHKTISAATAIALQVGVIFGVWVTDAFAQESVTLSCDGDMKYMQINTDGTIKETERREALNVKIDFTGSTTTLDGLIGTNCFEPECLTFPSVINNEEIVGYKKYVKTKYQNEATFTINRNTGSMKTTVAVTPLEGSGAIWSLFTGSGNFRCTPGVKKMF